MRQTKKKLKQPVSKSAPVVAQAPVAQLATDSQFSKLNDKVCRHGYRSLSKDERQELDILRAERGLAPAAQVREENVLRFWRMASEQGWMEDRLPRGETI